MRISFRQSLRLLISLVVLLALVPFAAARSDRYASNSIKIELKPGLNLTETAALIAQGVGKITLLHGGTVFISLNEGVELSHVLDVTRARPSVASVESIAPLPPFELGTERRLSVLKEAIAQYKEAYFAHKAVTEPDGDEDEIPGLGYLESLLYYIEERAYPFDEISYEGLREHAQKRIDEMNRSAIGSKSSLGNIKPASSQLNWEFVGPTNLNIPYRTYYGMRPINGRVNGISVHPTDPNTIYIAPAQGGPWKTTNGGTTWTPLGDDWPLMHTSAVVIDPNNPETLYVGTGDFHGSRGVGIGVMKSTDGGSNWSVYGGSVMGNSRISKVVVHPDDSTIVMASTGRGGTGRVYRSTDSGVNWTSVGLPGTSWTELTVGEPDGSGDRTFWAAGSGNPGYVYKSTDDGASWSAVTVPQLTQGNSVIAMATSKLDSETAYLVAPWHQNVVLKTVDGGTTWTNITAGMPTGYNWNQGWYDYWIGTSIFDDGTRVDDQVYVGLITTNMSTDGGASWRNVGGYGWVPTYNNQAVLHNDQHSFAMDPSDPNRVYFGCDGGIYRFDYDPGLDTFNYTLLNKNLGITQFYRITTHPTDQDYLFGGTQDNASPHSLGDIGNWENPGAGDGAGCIISPFDPDIQFHSWQNQGIRWTKNGFANQSTITPNWSGHSRPFIGKLILDPNNGRSMYANTNYMNRFNLNSETWELKLGGSPLTSNGRVNAMAVAKGDSNRIYAGSTDAELWMSTDFGSNWSRVDDSQKNGGSGLPNRAITSVSISPTDKNDVLVTMSGGGSFHVWRCFDTTAPTPTWVSVSGVGANGLPDFPINDIERDAVDPQNTWFVAADIGVWKTDNAGSSWIDMTRAFGLPNVTVGDLEIAPGTGYLNAGTYGRGWWRIPVDEPPARLQSLSFAPASIIGGASTTATLMLTAPAPVGGFDVRLLSINNIPIIPQTLTFPEGSFSMNFPVGTNSVGTHSSTAISAVGGGSSVTGFLDIRTIFDAAPETAVVIFGTYFNGNLASVQVSDDSYYQSLDVQDTVTTQYTSHLPHASVGGYSVTIESSTSTTPGITQTITAYNSATSQWDIVSTTSSALTDSTVVVPLGNNYADPVTDEVKIQVTFRYVGSPIPGGYLQKVDYVHWSRN